MTDTVNQTVAVTEAEGKPSAKAESNTDKVTLDQLARELKMSPRDARMLLRLAAKQTKLYPTLGKEHVARQPWQWMPGSKALDEARKALSATPTV
jgi:Spy/CpxP family protein refolding chaperone